MYSIIFLGYVSAADIPSVEVISWLSAMASASTGHPVQNGVVFFFNFPSGPSLWTPGVSVNGSEDESGVKPQKVPTKLEAVRVAVG